MKLVRMMDKDHYLYNKLGRPKFRRGWGGDVMVEFFTPHSDKLTINLKCVVHFESLGMDLVDYIKLEDRNV